MEVLFAVPVHVEYLSDIKNNLTHRFLLPEPFPNLSLHLLTPLPTNNLQV